MNKSKIKSLQFIGLVGILFGAQIALAFVLPVQANIGHPPPTAMEVQGQLSGNTFRVESTPPPGFSAHWYQGSIAPWSLFPPTSTYLSTSIKTPNGAPGSTEFYYVLLSCFNDIGSYCQIGFAAVDGHWGITWCWTEWSGYTMIYNYDADAYTLSQNTQYNFIMYIAGDGDLEFSVYQGRTEIWDRSVNMDADYFLLTSTYWHGWGYPTLACFTNYEEIYDTDAETPDFNFKFQYTTWTSGYWDSWNVLDVNSPPDCTTLISTASHYVWVINPDA